MVAKKSKKVTNKNEKNVKKEELDGVCPMNEEGSVPIHIDVENGCANDEAQTNKGNEVDSSTICQMQCECEDGAEGGEDADGKGGGDCQMQGECEAGAEGGEDADGKGGGEISAQDMINEEKASNEQSTSTELSDTRTTGINANTIKKKRKTKKSKSEGKVPRPPTAYIMFFKEEINKDTYKGVRLPERAKQIGSAWRSMGDEARAPFQERAANAKSMLEEQSAPQ